MAKLKPVNSGTILECIWRRFRWFQVPHQETRALKWAALGPFWCHPTDRGGRKFLRNLCRSCNSKERWCWSCAAKKKKHTFISFLCLKHDVSCWHKVGWDANSLCVACFCVATPRKPSRPAARHVRLKSPAVSDQPSLAGIDREFFWVRKTSGWNCFCKLWM